jgi:nucleoside-diphosphate-sugar epimerase
MLRPDRAYNILVSGAASGLGSAVHRALGGVALLRGMALDDPAVRRAAPFDAIIHCGFNAAKAVPMGSAFSYLDDNVLMTQRLLDVPHRKFVYISSLDVYPRTGRAVGEHDDVDVSALNGLYAHTKLFSDLLVQRQAANALILRPATLLGPVMRPNTTTRVLTQAGCRVFLAAESRFNYVLHDDVVEFIAHALGTDLTGIYNIGSRDSLALSDIVAQLGLSVEFGNYPYDIGPVDSERAARIVPAFARGSWETLNVFIDALGPAYVGRGRLCQT